MENMSSVSGFQRSSNKLCIREDQEKGLGGNRILKETAPKNRLQRSRPVDVERKVEDHEARKVVMRSKAAAMERIGEEDQPKKLERQTTEEVNASAEAFIKKFRKQLMIQRLESMENYEEMLARGL